MEPPPRTMRRDQARLQLRNDVRYDLHHIRIELVGQAASRMQPLHVDLPQLSYQTYLVQLRADRRLFRSPCLLARLPSHYDRSPLYPMGMACVNPPSLLLIPLPSQTRPDQRIPLRVQLTTHPFSVPGRVLS